jgi:hypothetical protein
VFILWGEISFLSIVLLKIDLNTYSIFRCLEIFTSYIIIYRPLILIKIVLISGRYNIVIVGIVLW